MPALPFIDLTFAEQEELKQMVFDVLQIGCEYHQLELPKAPVSPGLLQTAASFVSLYVDQELRGCTGTFKAEQALWRDVCEHAFSSAFEDSRFPSLFANELSNCRLIISVLSPMLPMVNKGESALLEELKPGIDGLMLQQGRRRALFLPVVWGSLSQPRAFVNGLKRKGGWAESYWSDDIEIFRFNVVAQY